MVFPQRSCWQLIIEKVTTLDFAWTFQIPDIPVTYAPSINGRMSETNKAKKRRTVKSTATYMKSTSG